MNRAAHLVLDSVRASMTVPRGTRVLAAWSGGPDSTILVWALKKLSEEGRITVETAHIDHGLRVNSAQEADEVQRWSEALQVPFHQKLLSLRPGEPGIQEKARAARYTALFELARDLDCSWVATGHNWDDQAETVLMRILRGAHIRGLRGILPQTEDGKIRPLLGTSRSLIYEALRALDLPFLEDPSNRSERFLRARLRFDLLPRLRAQDPGVDERLVQIANQARAHWSSVAPELHDIIPGRALKISTLKALPKVTWGTALSTWLRAPCAKKHVNAIHGLVQSGAAQERVSAPGGHTVHKTGGFLVAGPRAGPPDFAEAFQDIISLGRFIDRLPNPKNGSTQRWRLVTDGVGGRWKDRLRKLGVPDALRSIWPGLCEQERLLGLLGEPKISSMIGIEPPRELFKLSCED